LDTSRGSAYSSRSSLPSERASQPAPTPTIDLSGRDASSRVLSRYSRPDTTDRTGGSTPSTFDLSRRTSTFESSPTRSRVGTLADATVHISDGETRSTRRVSTVPRLYGSTAEPSRFPAAAQRRALSERLRAASSIPSGNGTDTSGLAERYTPSLNEPSSRLRKGFDSDSAARRDKSAVYPGQTRRDAAERLGRHGPAGRDGGATGSSGRTDAKRISSARSQAMSSEESAGDSKSWERMRNRYEQASAKDPELRKRMAAASQGAAIASDLVLRTALGSTRNTRGLSGYGGVSGHSSGSGQGSYGDRWSGYGYGSWSNWYWNSCFPNWTTWWFGCSSGWFPGWGWGWGNCYAWGFKPWWSWSCYYPSYYSYCWPTYAYVSPSIIYSYYEVEVPVYREVAAEPTAPAVATSATSAPSRVPDIGLRAATEYMALGDRAFTEGRYGDAVHYYAKAIEFAPGDGVLYLVLSDALFATGDYHYAAFALRRALELHPELATLGIDKRSFYGDAGDFDRQLELLERFLSDHVIDDDARFILAANYLFGRQPEKCVELLDSAFSVDLKTSSSGQLLLAASLELLAKSN
jgi:hypothetical protein